MQSQKLQEIKCEADDCTTESFESMKRVHEDNNEDYCSLYGQLLAKKLRKLDDRTREIVMNDIDNLIFRAKMNPNDSHDSAAFDQKSDSYFPESHIVNQGLNLLYVNPDPSSE